MTDSKQMAPVAVVTALMLIEYFAFTLMVARARVRGNVMAPAVSGDPMFERCFRVQQNTIERLIVVVPAMWMFGWYIDAPIGAGIGLVFVIGRYAYQRGYVTDPSQRGMGFGIGMLAEVTLLLGALGGATLTWFR